MQGDVREPERIRQHDRQRQEGDPQLGVPDASRISESLGHPAIGRDLRGLDRHFEDGPGQHEEDPAAEQRDENTQG